MFSAGRKRLRLPRPEPSDGRGAEAVIFFQLVQLGDVFQLAIAVGRVLLERPVAARLRRRATRQTNEQSGDVFAAEAVANIELFRGPRLGHLRSVGDAGIGVGGVREQRARIGRGRGDFDLRLLFGERRLDVLWTKGPARSQKDNEKNGEHSDDKLDGRVRSCGRARASTRNAGNLRHLRLEAIRWGLIGHWASLRFYTQRRESSQPT